MARTMTVIPRSHPRYRSLLVRAGLAEEMQRGLVVPEGLMAHGRGEAFDYLLGERTTPSAARAAQAAAARLLLAERPVLSVNGNVAALASREVAALARAIPHLRVEVNLFHRTPRRAELVAHALRAAGVKEVLGVRPTARLRGLASDRSWVDPLGILRADVVLVPLEDGDRAQALVLAGKFVIAIDLNPLSRTAVVAQLPIIDELSRALSHVRREAVRLRRKAPRTLRAIASSADGPALRGEALSTIRERLLKLSRMRT
ncbi:MAG: phosphopantothenate/pantothenate synthetase [Euryarchaeota archaeon]|nr:phosphopantothenate/pantothenate synthetase [Euryarchaeota archaeon]MDE2044113.1 phosphopantothenate/pantothenate synthetase [Thermoplasmata archaeon]